MNNLTRNDYERQLQAQAEQAERARRPACSDDPASHYRLVMRALRQPLTVALPDDFSVKVMQRIAERERQSEREDVIVSGLLMLLVALGAWLAYPYLVAGIGQMRESAPFLDALAVQLMGRPAQVPWTTLAVAVLGVGAALTLERLLSRPLP